MNPEHPEVLNTRSKLYAALSKAQAAIKPAELNSENPHFRSSYADLKSVWDACRGPLTDNGLSITQTFGLVEKMPVLITTLGHSSGECISSTIPLFAKEMTPQALGSSITYMRRYALAAIVGVAPDDDDDGNQATHATNGPATRNAPAASKHPIQKTNPSNPGEYVVEFGKFNGQLIRDIPQSEARDYIEFLESAAKKKGEKGLNGRAAAFQDAFENYWGEENQDQSPANNADDPFGQLPF